MLTALQDLMLLFDGDRRAYGTYGVKLTEQEGGKQKGSAASITGEVTVELWKKHIAGKQGLGIIPINEASKVKFAAIDIDQYPLNFVLLNQQIHKHKLPLVVCRTKSGGAHVYAFLTEFTDAEPIQRRMREFASILGHGNAEIYPKQSKIVSDRGDVGSWINMPYFDAAATQRYGFDWSGKQLDMLEFVAYAKHVMVSPQDFLAFKVVETEALVDGPPCLNHLVSMGFPPGTRNNGLLNMGVYAKKFNPDSWQSLVEEYNQKYMNPPLETIEVLGVIKSLQRKDFCYMCKQPPIAQYCNAPRCRTKKYGVGMGDLGMPKFGSLTKLSTVPPIWFLEVEGGGRLELTTDELQSQRLFQNKCMEVLNVMPIMPKNDMWQELVHRLLMDVNIVEMPPEVSPVGQLRQHLEDFLLSRVQARTSDELLLGKPWLNNGFHYFRFKDFLAYLERQKFRDFKPTYVGMYLKEWGTQPKFWNIRGAGCNCLMIKEIVNKKQTESFDTPPQDGKVPY
jgi:hypothetical protein